MHKKIISGVFSLTLAFCATIPITPAIGDVEKKSVTDYTYTITPILEPFNEYFFVKTDNPDPTSFRFADKSSVYSEDANICLDWDDWDEEINLYADINYENRKTGRVNGGYIFKSYDTDGGEIVLQTKNDAYYSWDVTWSDTKVKLKLPTLKDDVDYLIDTYAVKSDFFDNMDAVRAGFSSICLYSGSHVRGELYKAGSFWSLSNSPHKDQLFYLQSPYARKDNKRLFASAVYPYRYDSLGFPSMMGAVSKRLDSSSSYVWNSYWHYLIDVTYDGETRSYGGQGNGEGQGISEDKIKQHFSFGTNGTKITFESIRQLLDDYSKIEMEDDVPRDDAITWESVCNRVGDGAWVRLTKIGSVFGGSSSGYAYFYKNGDGKNHNTEQAGDKGTEIYWGGDLRYAHDAWIDGRYVDSYEVFVPGEKYEDHPTSNIILSNVTIPKITYDGKYKYNDSTGQYEYEYTNVKVEEIEKTVLFEYSKDKNEWIASDKSFDSNLAGYGTIVDFVEKGLVDEKYIDMVTLTPDEVIALKVDKNTDAVPDDYFIYDGTTEPGISLKEHKHNYESEITKKSTSTTAGVKTYTCTVCGETKTESIARISGVTLSSSSYTYDGKAKKPKVTVKDIAGKVIPSSNYTVTYIKNTNAGKATVKVTMKEDSNYKGTLTKTFTINKVANKLTATSSYTKTASSKAQSFLLNAKATGGKLTYKSSSKSVTVSSTGKVTIAKNFAGKATITITAGGTNHKTVTKAVTVTVKPAATKITSAKNLSSRKATINWLKLSYVSGYQIQYGTNSNFSGAKTTTVSGASNVSKVLSGLAKGKTYYVRVRTYKTVGKTKLYSSWSAKKSVKISK